MAKATAKVEFVRRGRRSETETAHRMSWRSLCGVYRITRSESKYGLPLAFYAEQVDGERIDVISRHRTKSAAEKAVNIHAKGN